MFTIQSVWDESVVFLRRERALLVPLALATLGLGNLVIELVQNAMPAGTPSPSDAALTLLLLPALLWVMVGQLAIITLALRAGCSVGEALRHGAARLGINLLIGFIIGVALLVLLLPLLIPLAPYAPQMAARDYSHIHLPTWAILWCVALFVALLYVGARLFVLSAVTVERRGDPISLLRQSFALTRGVVGRILPFSLGVALFTLLMQGAIAASIGLLGALLGKLIGMPFIGNVIESIAQSTLVAALGCVQAVFVARSYQRLTERRPLI